MLNENFFFDSQKRISDITTTNTRDTDEILKRQSKHCIISYSSQIVDEIAVIIPVHNALTELRKCMDTLWQSDAANCCLYIINDGSDTETTAYLHNIKNRIHLIEHKTASGYTVSINEALRLNKLPYVVIANSDLEFPHHWLTRLFACLKHADDIGIVGPLSNAASYQNVPFLYDRWEGFRINVLPEMMSVNDFNEFIYKCSKHTYPQIPIANGFCMLIKREVLEQLNYFDEINFPIGYGEEDDFCWRASKAGYKIICADDVYIYHAKSRSFGKNKREELVTTAKKRLDLKYPNGDFAKYAHSSNFNTKHIRNNIIQSLINYYITISQ